MAAGLEREEEALCRSLEKGDPGRQEVASSRSPERRDLGPETEAADQARGRET